MKLLNLGILLISVLFSGCAGTPRATENAALPDLVWPSASEQPRIRWLYTLSSAEDMEIKQGWFKAFVMFLKGEDRRKISSPYGIKRGPEGRLYVVDTFYKIVHVFDTKNARYYWFPKRPPKNFLYPIDVALGKNGVVYVSDSVNRSVHVFSEYGNKYVKEIGKGRLQRPTGMAVNTLTDELLVIDTVSSQIIVYDIDSLLFKKAVGQESKDKGGFHSPTAIFAAADGKVYVSDSLNFRIQILSPELEFIRTFGEVGDAPGYFSRPKGVAADSEGHLYVVDALFDNVQIFNNDGRLLLSFGSPGQKRGQFWLPNAIFIDAQDRIYVSDAYNKRVQVFQYLKQGGRP